MVTRVPCDQSSVNHASSISGPSRPPLPSLSHLLDDGLGVCDCLMPPFGSCARHPIGNDKM
jgi:hypothetical protein